MAELLSTQDDVYQWLGYIDGLIWLNSVSLERLWTVPEMSVRCSAGSAVTVEPNSGQAVFVTVAASVRCWL